MSFVSTIVSGKYRIVAYDPASRRNGKAFGVWTIADGDSDAEPKPDKKLGSIYVPKDQIDTLDYDDLFGLVDTAVPLPPSARFKGADNDLPNTTRTAPLVMMLDGFPGEQGVMLIPE